MELMLLVIVGIVLVGVLSYHSHKKRIEGLTAFAAKHGFTFSKHANDSFLGSLTYFYIFSQGHSRGASCMLQGLIEGIKVAVFD